MKQAALAGPFVLAPLFLFPRQETAFLLMIVPLLWVLSWREGEILPSTPIDLPVLGILIQVLVSCFFISDINSALPKIAGICLGICIYYSIVSIMRNPDNIRSGINLLIGSGLVFSFLGILGMFTFRVKSLNILEKIKDYLPYVNFRLPGAEDGFHPNAVGGTLLLILPLALMITIYETRVEIVMRNRMKLRSKIFVLMAASILIVAILILTQSRGAWTALFLSAFILSIMSIPSIIKRYPEKKIIILCIILTGLSLFLVMGLISRRMIFENFSGRGAVWAIGIKTIIENPMTGIGVNQIRYFPEVGFKTAHVHNQLLQTGAELGLPGLICWISMLIGLASMFYSVVRKCPDNKMRTAMIGLGWGQLAFAIFGMNDAIPLGAKTSIFFWISSAFIVSLYTFVEKRVK